MSNNTSNLKGLSVVIPVYNEDENTIRYTVNSLQSLGAEVIVVDDGSKIPFCPSIYHEQNRGYGAALMTGINHANNEVVLTMDGDGQHTVNDVCNLWDVWNMLNVDMLIGKRKIKDKTIYRYWGRKMLNLIASIVCNFWIPDLNSGMRIFRKSLSQNYFPITCPQFSFTTSITINYMCDGYSVEWFPINVRERPHGKSKVKVVKDGLTTLYYILRNGLALRTRHIRSCLRKLYGKN